MLTGTSRILVPLTLALLILMPGNRVPGAEAPGAKAAADARQDFDRDVAPLLASYCLDCHRGEDAEGGLDLSRGSSARKGGDSGVAIVPGKAAASLLWQRVARDEMPPKQALPPEARQALRRWLDSGAAWGTDPIDPFRYTTDKRAGRDWWSLQPLASHPVPRVAAAQRVRNPVDAFLLDRLERQGLSYSDDAEPRLLIRRLYLDLIGLPPSPEEVQQFRADPSDAAYRQLVDRLLDSPHYGERWGRHWLDVARFGESDGFERNNPRQNLWPYRDWVIQALNDDMPYDRFIRMQIAGDILTGGSPEGLAAVGFLVAGVHNTVVGSSEMMRRVARQDELEEIIGTVGQTFLGLTVNCGRCHDHKFDPIPQEEYYRLTAAIAGVQHGERQAPVEEVQASLEEVRTELERLEASMEALQRPLREQLLAERRRGEAPPPELPAAIAAWDFKTDLRDRVGELHGQAMDGARLENGALVLDGKGYVWTATLADDLTAKTLEVRVQLDDLEQRGGAAISVQTPDGAAFDAIVFGEREPQRWMAGSDSFRRTQSFQGEPEEKAQSEPVHVAIVYAEDGTITAYRNGKPYGKPYRSQGPHKFLAGGANVVFGLRHAPPGGNRMLRGRVLQARLYARALNADEVAAAAGAEGNYVSTEELTRRMTPEQRDRWNRLRDQRQQLLARREQLVARSQRKVYTVNPASPPVTHLLRRGDVMDRGQPVSPGGVDAIAGMDGDFGLSGDASDAERRRKLAEWLSDRRNPLPARVIVNRLWHYHFGVGIVETPNDLGFNGGRPSHPELLDWLALQLVHQDYRLKPLHRLLVTSTAYRQASAWNADAARKDAGNRLLWRKSPRRMDAEVLRDSMLQVSGTLNAVRGGPGFADVTVTVNNGTTYYEPFDREAPELNRRTVYRFSPRGGRSALLDTFDCPDPSSAAPRRSVTTTPLQALSLLNNPFVLRMAGHLADRVREDVGDDVDAQVVRIWQLTYARDPDREERELAAKLIRDHGLVALGRALMNSNEFVIIQ